MLQAAQERLHQASRNWEQRKTDYRHAAEMKMEASREKVKIPGAEAHRVPEEFRKDLLDAMKQGAPERYRSEVQRYYEELVK